MIKRNMIAGDRIFFSKIAGITHGERQKLAKKLKKGDILFLIPDPDNQFDTNAVKVTRKGINFGYLPAYHALNLQLDIQNGYKFFAQVIRITGGYLGKKTIGVNLAIYKQDK